MVRNDLLFAPALTPGSKRQIRKLCFPYPDKWYSMNLRPDEPLDAPLLSVAEGGSRISDNCQFSDEEKQMPYITLIYTREGGIIPKIGVRDYIPDHSLPRPDANPITLHIYPGKDSTYNMYLDDGISRDGAPNFGPAGMKVGDKKAANKYCQVDIKQYTKSNNDDSGVLYMRKVTIKSPFNGFGDLKEFVSTEYRADTLD
ncbi:hypothetical protein FPRO06_13733 [Fusarium proliferatum]|nr:hypothetical protein FPRO06_13733 [Fusarium proliferatum]